MNRLWLASLFAATCLSSYAQDEEITLRMGDPAPALDTGAWIQGDPVTAFETGKIHVVEFWATWCGPCRYSIPHLNELQKQYADKGVIVIGQNASERGANVEEKVRKFVEGQGDKMTYRVALDKVDDKGRGRMNMTWMAAAGQGGIPTAFVVDQTGRIAWIGHPMDGLDKVLAALVDGSFDLQKVKQEAEEKAAIERNEQEAQQKMAAMLKPYEARMDAAFKEKDWAAALAVTEEMDKVVAGSPYIRPSGMDPVRFRIMVAKKDAEGAAKVALSIAEKEGKNPMVLNDYAWMLLTEQGLEPRQVDTALRLANAARGVTGDSDPAILDTLARATFMKGDKEAAIALQEKALAAIPAENTDARATFEGTLDSYRRGELPKP